MRDMVTMVVLVLLPLGSFGIWAAWDTARRRIASQSAVADLEKRVDDLRAALESRITSVQTRVENIGDLINAAKASNSSRMPPRLMR